MTAARAALLAAIVSIAASGGAVAQTAASYPACCS